MEARPLEVLEKALTFELAYFLSIEDIDEYLKLHGKNYREKERVGNKDNLIFHIHSNDHEPPHFHVRTKDGTIDAKFLIEDCSLMDGTISSKDRKKVETFHRDIKAQIIWKIVWRKRYEQGRTDQ